MYGGTRDGGLRLCTTATEKTMCVLLCWITLGLVKLAAPLASGTSSQQLQESRECWPAKRVMYILTRGVVYTPKRSSEAEVPALFGAPFAFVLSVGINFRHRNASSSVSGLRACLSL